VWGAAAGHHQPQEHGQDGLGKVTQELLTRHDSPSMSASTRHVPMRTARRARGEVQTSVRRINALHARTFCSGRRPWTGVERDELPSQTSSGAWTPSRE